jgi:hypothetical protein
MARAYGSSAHLLMKRETAYGQAATGNYLRMPFNRCNLGSEQGLIDDPVLGQGRDAAGRMLTVTLTNDLWDGLRMMHNVLLRLANSSVDVRP